jgi:hypothetical protein
MFVDPGEEQRERELWIKRWNTMKNWLAEEIEKDYHDDCCYGTLNMVQNAMSVVEGMTEDE